MSKELFVLVTFADDRRGLQRLAYVADVEDGQLKRVTAYRRPADLGFDHYAVVEALRGR